MGKRMGVVWALAILLVFSTVVAMAAPGDVRWEYISTGGVSDLFGSTRVVVDKNGNRILGTTSSNNVSSSFPGSRILIGFDREGHFNWQRTSERSLLCRHSDRQQQHHHLAEVISDASFSTLQWHIVS